VLISKDAGQSTALTFLDGRGQRFKSSSDHRETRRSEGQSAGSRPQSSSPRSRFFAPSLHPVALELDRRLLCQPCGNPDSTDGSDRGTSSAESFLSGLVGGASPLSALPSRGELTGVDEGLQPAATNTRIDTTRMTAVSRGRSSDLPVRLLGFFHLPASRRVGARARHLDRSLSDRDEQRVVVQPDRRSAVGDDRGLLRHNVDDHDEVFGGGRGILIGLRHLHGDDPAAVG
jgi:hypothetical protein